MDPQMQAYLQIAQLPMVALLALAVYKVYTDANVDRDKAAAERAHMLDRLESVYDRLLTVQKAVGVDDPPTLPRKPPTSGVP